MSEATPPPRPDPSNDPTPSPAPLDYARPQRAADNVGYVVAGVFSGMAMVGVSGFLIALLVERLAGRPLATHSMPAAVGFGAVGAVALTSFFRGIGRSRPGLWQGALVGAGVVALLEGMCFAGL